MMDFTFEDSLWEQTLPTLKDSIDAERFLALLEEEDESAVEDAFSQLCQRNITLDVSKLPKVAGVGEAAVRLRREEQLAKSGNLLQDLEDTDPLKLYLQEIAGIPACGDLNILAEELKENKDDPQLQQTILNLSLSRVFELACRHTGYGVLLLDLIQEGSMGLWQNLSRYDGGDFAAFRDWNICQSMACIITLQARNQGVGQKMRQALEDYRSVDEKLLTELGRNPTREEIAEELHMSVAQTEIVESMLQTARDMHRAKAEREPKEPQPEEEQAVEDTAYFQARQRIQELLSSLDEPSAKLLTLRFGLEGGLPKSPEETGRILGLTPEEVVAAEAAALLKLREQK
ncbi:MAG: sigma-70 family RNA polymerase sigma factor [Oscillospiraceae bacterium]|nr:sigma-70 family RNA polymerase sigma factor [Oscillospiraceae bacterium]